MTHEQGGLSRARRAVRHRTLTPLAIFSASVTYILRHPANRAHRFQALSHAASAWWSYRRTGTPLLVPIGRHSRIRVRPRLLSFGESVPTYGNPPDYWETTLLTSVLRPGDVFVDVGANSGIYTLLAVECGAEVIALEPGTAARGLLLDNLRLNDCTDRVRVHASAAGRQAGSTQFTLGTHVLNHIVDPSAAAPAPNDALFPLARPTGYETVEVVTIDELVGDRTIMAMKIDVEGFEQDVIEGAQRALREHRIGYLQIESNDLSTTHFGRSAAPVWSILRSSGYTLHQLDGNGAFIPQPETPCTGEVIAVAPDGSFWSRLETSRWPGPR